MLILLVFSALISVLLFFLYTMASYWRYKLQIKKLPLRDDLSFYFLPLKENLNSGQRAPAKVYLIHGTFAVSAPLKDWVRVIEKRIPKLATFLFHLSKIIIDIIYSRASDVGIFLDDYAEKLKYHYNLNCSLFYWSGHNDHYARLTAAFKLIDQIKKDNVSEKEIILVGHSHGGSILAICTQIIYNANFLQQLEKTLPTNSTEFHPGLNETKKNALELKNKKWSIITLGMAPRYHFYPHSNISILNLIHSPKAFAYSRHWPSLFYGPKGDLIQQWALSGSDTKSLDFKIRNINKKLDLILDQGCNLFTWGHEIKKLKRISPYGKTILLEFDGGYSIVNAVKSIMGHGQYTQLKYLPDLWQIIFKHLEQ